MAEVVENSNSEPAEPDYFRLQRFLLSISAIAERGHPILGSASFPGTGPTL